MFANKIGVNVGKDCKFINSPNWGSEPWLITIGDHVEISFDVAFVTHDGSPWVFRNQENYRNIIKFGKIEIKNNCFIGCRSTILPGVTVGENSIIAAGSVVNKSIPPNSVYGGVPAKYIMSTNELRDKLLACNPLYNIDNFKNDMKSELLKIL